MIRVSKLLAPWIGQDRIVAMAERVAGRSRLTVWNRVAHRLDTLGADGMPRLFAGARDQRRT
jgi:hypothetical protein